MYNGSYFYISFFVCELRKRKRILRYPFPILYHEIEKRKTKGRYIHGTKSHCGKQNVIFAELWKFGEENIHNHDFENSNFYGRCNSSEVLNKTQNKLF